MSAATDELMESARQQLLLGIKCSGQRSYERRLPSEVSLPLFDGALHILADVLQREPRNCEALLLMSQVYENLLCYDKAVDFLSKAFETGEPKSHKLLRRLAMLNECAKKWKKLILRPEELHNLGQYLQFVGIGPGHRSLEHTREWIVAHLAHDPEEIIHAFGELGAYSDFQVLENIVLG